MRRLFLVLVLVVTAVLATAFTVATHTRNTLPIRFDPGGGIITYIEKYEFVARSGGSLKIDGACISACTLFTGLVDPENVCITSRAFLGFHSASFETPMGAAYSEDGTQLIWNIYPKVIREWLQTKGWKGDEHPSLIFMDNDELSKLYKPCTGNT
jgi:hypothetical protein